MSEISSIHWFPGHMMKTLRLIEADIKNVDAVAELIDARIPFSSKNPELARLTDTKPRILLLNKCDLADDKKTKLWLDYYGSQGYGAIEIQSKEKKYGARCISSIKSILETWQIASGKKNLTSKPRVMVVGIPNVGKSTFINMIAGTSRAKAEDRPGVTRGKQWISLDEIELLDMPGVLWKKLENQEGALKLAFTGAIKDDILNKEEIAICLLEALKKEGYQKPLFDRFKLTDDQLTKSGIALLEQVGRNRGMLILHGQPDVERAAITVLDELRSGKLGRITFEEPSEYGF
ncbi:MAG: ribosome biogenesis GTPase YlqF [Oscillospiraceae bacterium]